VSQQLAFGRDYHLNPHISFGESIGLSESREAGLMPSIIARARENLAWHMSKSNVNSKSP